MTSLPASAAIDVASPTLLDRLLGCPLRVAFERAAPSGGGRQAPPQPRVLVGNAIHRTIELCFLSPSMELQAAWNEACDEMAPTDGDPRSAPSARRAFLRLQRRLPELRAYVDGLAADSILCEHTVFSPDGRVRGRVDLLVLGARPAVIDHKTGVVLEDGVTIGHFHRQLAIYAWLASVTMQSEVNDAALFSLRDGLVEVDVSATARQSLVAEALSALETYNDRVPREQPAAPSEVGCGTCRFVGRCDPAWRALTDGVVERLGWGEAIRGVASAPVVVAAADRSAVQVDVEVGTVSGPAVVVTDVPTHLASGLGAGDRLAAWGLSLRSENPVTLRWRDGSSAIERSP